MGGSRVIFNANKLKKDIMKNVSEIQTRLFIDYAEEEIKSIGNDISVANTKNNLDRTGNLLDSLCWGVCFDGKLKKWGYYRDETAVEDSYLHEYSRPKGESVNGHIFAQNFLASYSPSIQNGWEVFFAILAPYWGYWEKGFTDKFSNKFFQWQVLTHHFDKVKRDLEPCKVEFSTYIP